MSAGFNTIEREKEIAALRSEVADLQATIIRLTRELDEARDAEAAEIVAWLRGQAKAKQTASDELQKGSAKTFLDCSALVTRILANAIDHHEHRKELSHD